MNDRKTLAAVYALIQSERQEEERRRYENHDSCLALKNKLEYLVKSPTRETVQIKNVGKYADMLRDRRNVYYTGCDELRRFVNERKDTVMSFTVRDDAYVNYVSSPDVVNNDKLNYTLFRRSRRRD